MAGAILSGRAYAAALRPIFEAKFQTHYAMIECYQERRPVSEIWFQGGRLYRGVPPEHDEDYE